jgi:hypothetical protein
MMTDQHDLVNYLTSDSIGEEIMSQEPYGNHGIP